MKDNISLYKTPKAIGKVCVELKNPKTGEVVKKVEGYNHVWTDNLFTTDWYDWLQYSTLCLTNYTGEQDTSLPFIPGNLIGYGYYNCTGSGNLRGIYNSANSFIRKQTETGKISKFSYDFAANQANGTINYIGFSEQFQKIVNYKISESKYRYNRYKFSPRNIYYGSNLGDHQLYIVQDPNDVKYIYIPITSSYSSLVGASSFVVTKMNLLSGEIDNLFNPPISYNSASNNNQRIIIDNNNYYWLCDNKLYKYSDSNFKTLGKEYTIPFIDTMNSSSPSAKRTTIIDDILYTYQPIEQGSSTAKWFSVDLNAEKLELNPFTLETTFDSGYFNTPTFSSNATNIGHIIDIPNSKYKTVSFVNENTSYTNKACIIDFSNKKIIGFLNPDYYLSYYPSTDIPFFRLPINSDQGIWKMKNYFIGSSTSTDSFYNVGAISAFKLPQPITKTSEHAMTVTYEIEVRWSEGKKGE